MSLRPSIYVGFLAYLILILGACTSRIGTSLSQNGYTQSSSTSQLPSPAPSPAPSGTPAPSPTPTPSSTPTPTPNPNGKVYYVDFSTGSDSNLGTAKSNPWKHSPGMQGCTSSCSTTALNPGDFVIFKGGVVWDHTCFSMKMIWSGNARNPIYFGVDQSWYVGSSWTRPIFSGDHTNVVAGDGLINIVNQNYITVDNIELRGLVASSNFGPANIELSCSTNILMSNLYIHDWALSQSVANDDAHGGVIANNPYCDPAGTVIDHSVISNIEHTGSRQNGVGVRSTDVQFSVIHDVATAQLFGRLHDSLIYNVSYPSGNNSFDPSYHTNVTYIAEWSGNGQPPTSPAYIYNNVIHDFAAGSGGLYPNICLTQANATYMWNNVIYNNFAGGNSDIQIEPYGQGSGCGDYYVWNNTLQMPQSTQSPLIRIVNRGFPIGKLVMQNNHFVTDSGVFDQGGGVQNLTNTFNVTQTNNQASLQGYTLTETFALSPISMSGATVNAGTNLTSSCSGNVSPLCSDTTYGIGFNSTNNSVSSQRSTHSRPTSGSWDAGAYKF